MAKRKKRLTRAEKRAMNPDGAGNSKYANKIKRRKSGKVSKHSPFELMDSENKNDDINGVTFDHSGTFKIDKNGHHLSN